MTEKKPEVAAFLVRQPSNKAVGNLSLKRFKNPSLLDVITISSFIIILFFSIMTVKVINERDGQLYEDIKQGSIK